MRLQCAELLRDSRNLDLLRLLREDPRISISELARRIGMSAPAVRERVLRLEEAGIIRGYTVELDPAALGYPLSAFVRCVRRPDDCRRWRSRHVASRRSASAIASPAMIASC